MDEYEGFYVQGTGSGYRNGRGNGFGKGCWHGYSGGGGYEVGIRCIEGNGGGAGWGLGHKDGSGRSSPVTNYREDL